MFYSCTLRSTVKEGQVTLSNGISCGANKQVSSDSVPRLECIRLCQARAKKYVGLPNDGDVPVRIGRHDLHNTRTQAAHLDCGVQKSG